MPRGGRRQLCVSMLVLAAAAGRSPACGDSEPEAGPREVTLAGVDRACCGGELSLEIDIPLFAGIPHTNVTVPAETRWESGRCVAALNPGFGGPAARLARLRAATAGSYTWAPAEGAPESAILGKDPPRVSLPPLEVAVRAEDDHGSPAVDLPLRLATPAGAATGRVFRTSAEGTAAVQLPLCAPSTPGALSVAMVESDTRAYKPALTGSRAELRIDAGHLAVDTLRVVETDPCEPTRRPLTLDLATGCGGQTVSPESPGFRWSKGGAGDVVAGGGGALGYIEDRCDRSGEPSLLVPDGDPFYEAGSVPITDGRADLRPRARYPVAAVLLDVSKPMAPHFFAARDSLGAAEAATSEGAARPWARAVAAWGVGREVQPPFRGGSVVDARDQLLAALKAISPPQQAEAPPYLLRSAIARLALERPAAVASLGPPDRLVVVGADAGSWKADELLAKVPLPEGLEIAVILVAEDGKCRLSTLTSTGEDETDLKRWRFSCVTASALGSELMRALADACTGAND